jgi:hypothetical protein
MTASPAHAPLPIRTTRIPMSPRPTIRIPTQNRELHSDTLVNCLEAKSLPQLPRFHEVPRPILGDIRNTLPSASMVPDQKLRPSARVDRLPKTPRKPTPPSCPPSSLRATLYPQPLTICTAPVTSPLVIRREDPKTSAPTVREHVRSRHRTSSSYIVIPQIAPRNQSYSRGFPSSLIFVDCVSFALLKNSEFPENYELSASSASLATPRYVSGSRRYGHGESRTEDHQSVPAFQHAKVATSIPLATPIESPIVREPALPRRQPLKSSGLDRLPSTKLHSSPCHDRSPSTRQRTKDDAIGFPVDMLAMLNSLDTLANLVKTLKMPSRQLRPKIHRRAHRQDAGERYPEHTDLLTSKFPPIGGVPLRFNKLEKGKWRATADLCHNANEKSPISSVNTLRPSLLLLMLMLLSSQRVPLNLAMI